MAFGMERNLLEWKIVFFLFILRPPRQLCFSELSNWNCRGWNWTIMAKCQKAFQQNFSVWGDLHFFSLEGFTHTMPLSRFILLRFLRHWRWIQVSQHDAQHLFSASFTMPRSWRIMNLCSLEAKQQSSSRFSQKTFSITGLQFGSRQLVEALRPLSNPFPRVNLRNHHKKRPTRVWHSRERTHS